MCVWHTSYNKEKHRKQYAKNKQQKITSVVARQKKYMKENRCLFCGTALGGDYDTMVMCAKCHLSKQLGGKYAVDSQGSTK